MCMRALENDIQCPQIEGYYMFKQTALAHCIFILSRVLWWGTQWSQLCQNQTYEQRARWDATTACTLLVDASQSQAISTNKQRSGKPQKGSTANINQHNTASSKFRVSAPTSILLMHLQHKPTTTRHIKTRKVDNFNTTFL